MKLDPITKQQCIDYADTESDVRGFPRGSAKWKEAFKRAASEAIGTMSLGRNPRSNPRTSALKAYIELYPDIFSSNGFAGKVARAYKGKQDKAVDLEEIQNRILSSVVNLSKLFENGIGNVKTTTRGTQQGKIANDAMSDYQFPNKPPGVDEKQWANDIRTIVFNWFLRDAVMNCILESLSMFWQMSKGDISDVMQIVEIKALTDKQAEGSESSKSLMETVAENRKRWIVMLQGRVHPAAAALNFKKLVRKD